MFCCCSHIGTVYMYNVATGATVAILIEFVSYGSADSIES